MNTQLFTSTSWLYTQLEPDRAASLVDNARLRHYQRIFAAHMDGLVAADDSIIEVAAAELTHWKGDGELFAAAYSALARQNPSLFTVVWDFLLKHPQQHFVEAFAHVFSWLPTDKVQEILTQWHNAEAPLLQRIALAARGLRREAYHGDLATLFAHEDAALRAEACRYAGRLRRFDSIPYLRRALTDADPYVREQAAIALLVCNEPAAALPELFAAVLRYAAAVDHGGMASIRAERRAQHLARLLGHAIPFPCTEAAAETLLAELPPYLGILTLAHHGNPACIPQLLPYLHARADGLYKRRALWALSFIMGINPEHEGLLADNPSLSADWPIAPGLDQDTGLPEGDAERVEPWWQMRHASFVPAHSPVLSGRCIDAPVQAQELLTNGMQAQRFAAALHVCRLSKTAVWLDTRAPWAMQRRWMADIAAE